MSLLQRLSSYLWHRGLRFSRAQLVPTIDLIASFSSSSSSSAQIDSLNQRISRAGDSSLPIVTVLHQWQIEEGKDVKLHELRGFIKQLRQCHRYKHALQISEWMSDQTVYRLSDADVAVRLDLISKVHGLEKAEKHFYSISESARGDKVYGAILNCFVRAGQLEKAEDMMQKIRDMGSLKTDISYNLMLHIYSDMGKYEKLDDLMQEMEEKGIIWNIYTLNTRLKAYVASSDIEGMEKFLKKMEVDSQIKTDIRSYITAAKGYLKAGFIDKTLMMLKRSEQLSGGDSQPFPYEVLLTLYSAIGNKAEVYRVWDLYKKTGRDYNGGRLCMISSLVKLDDMDGAEKVWVEWCSRKNINFDIRIPNLMISAYSRKGLWDKAETCINKMIENGNEPNAMSWDHLATGYQVGGQMTKAVEAIKNAISISKPRWKPNFHTSVACLKYLKDQGDIEAAKDFLEMVHKHSHFSEGVFNRLLSSINDGNFTASAPEDVK